MPYPSHTRSHRLRSSLRAMVATAIVVASSLALAPPASAKPYHLYTCHVPGGPVTSSEDWKGKRSGSAPLPEVNCLRNAYVYWNLGTSMLYSGDFAGVGLQLPEGLKATEITGARSVWLHPGSDDGATIAYDLISGDDWETAKNSHERCVFSAGCTGWDTWDRPEAPLSRIATMLTPASFIGFRLACVGEPWRACGGSYNNRGHVRIDQLDVTLDDAFPPVGGAASGTVTQEGPRSATETLSVAATDRGSGVYEAWVVVDGKEFERIRPDVTPSCNDIGPNPARLEFDRVQPCAGAVQAKFPFDTKRFADGQHRAEVWVRDAADNQTRVWEKIITIDNVPPPSAALKPSISGSTLNDLRPSDALTAQNGTWVGANIQFSQRWQRSTAAGGWLDIPNGTGATYRVGTDDVGQQLRVVVTAKNVEGATEAVSEPTGKVKNGATTIVQNAPTGSAPVSPVDSNGGGGNPATGQLVVDREQRTVDVKHGAKVVITGRLVDADGNPIGGALVDVYEQIAVTAAPWTKVDTVKTDAQGGYVYRPKTTSSRRLRFGFSELRGGATYRATREVFVSITAGMTISARSKVVPRRGLIQIGGQVVVDRLPSGGAIVEVQVLDAGIWRTVATRRANKDGRWAFKHRLRGASATRFTFRSRLRAAGDLPSAEAKSAPLKVRVR